MVQFPLRGNTSIDPFRSAAWTGPERSDVTRSGVSNVYE